MNNFLIVYVFCAIGVAFSVVLPILQKAVQNAFRPTKNDRSTIMVLWAAAKPYLILGLFSLVVALLLVAFLKDQLTDWRVALLSGYAADSTLQKLKG
jgi:MFS family permease